MVVAKAVGMLVPKPSIPELTTVAGAPVTAGSLFNDFAIGIPELPGRNPPLRPHHRRVPAVLRPTRRYTNDEI